VSSKVNFFNNYFSNNIFHFLVVFLLSIFPLLFFIGTGLINISIIILDIIFISELLIKKRLNFLKNYIFFSLILLWITFLINIVFSIDPLNSFNRGFGFIRFIFFIMLILYYLNINKKKYQNIILGSWLIIFCITSLDLIFELINGKNILGFQSYIHGRLAGFFNDELIIGHFYYAFILIILSFMFKILSNKKFNIMNKRYDLKNFIYLFIFLFLLISFLIGERSNFIKVLIMIFLFTFFFERKLFKLKIILFSLFFIFVVLIINSNDKYKKRFVNQFLNQYLKNPVESIFKSEHGGHYLTALKVYNNNKIFGVGFKNYSKEIKKKEYKHFFYYNSTDPSTHPHQIHFEFLADLGLFGYFSLMFFFIYHFYKCIKQRSFNDNLNLSGLLFILTSLLPLLPSGSFFTSHSATLFWMNFAFMSLNQKEINYNF
jgi:O-antigen ligase